MLAVYHIICRLFVNICKQQMLSEFDVYNTDGFKAVDSTIWS